jgi:hypothetical protein
MVSIIQRMKNNPRMTMGGFLFIVGLIVIIVWIVNRGKKGSTGSTGPGVATVEPELTVSGEKTVKSIKKSEYKIKREYAIGEILGDNIDYKLTINTMNGFEENGIVKLVAERISDDGTTLDTINIVNIANFTEYVVDFKGLNLEEDAVGKDGGQNTFEIKGYNRNGDLYENKPLASSDVNIDKEDLNYVLSGVEISDFTFEIRGSILEIGTSEISRSKYYMSILPGHSFSILPRDGKKYSFQLGDTKRLLSADDDDDNGNKVTEFDISKSGDRYRLISNGKLLTRDSGGNVVLVSPSSMTSTEASISLIDISLEPLPLLYPPKPYPGATGGNDPAKNNMRWTVSETETPYGAGEYRLEVRNALTGQSYDGALDGEGIMNTGMGSITGYNTGGDEHAFHSAGDGGTSWFHFYLPVYIKLDRIEVVPRGFNDTEIPNMKSSWGIIGIDSSSGTPVETNLFNENVEFKEGEIKSLVVTPSRRFNEFKVHFTPEASTYMVFKEILFYGTEEKKLGGNFPTITGLTGRYTVGSLTDTEWTDISGKGNDAEIKGKLSVDDAKYVYGSTSDGVRFPRAVMDDKKNYTLFYVGRYNLNSNHYRIFDGINNNWLSGFHGGHTGVAHHNDWMTRGNNKIYAPGGWLMGTDTIGKFRANGVNMVTNPIPNTNVTNQITINWGQLCCKEEGSETSNWAMKEVIFYDRILTTTEMEQVEKYMSAAHGIPIGAGLTDFTRGRRMNGFYTDSLRGSVEVGWGELGGERVPATIESCRAYGEKHDLPGFLFRDNKHTEPRYRNTCSVYDNMSGPNKEASWIEDTSNHVYCTDPDGIVRSGC